MAWHHLQYALGLAQLGHEVLFLEDSDDYASCYDPERNVMDTDPSYGLAFAKTAFAGIRLPDCWAYYDAHTTRWHGPAAERAPGFCGTADILLNISGVNPLRPWLTGIPVRALIDTDPVFIQIRHLQNPAACDLAVRHNRFFTFGENFGAADARIPDDGFAWLPTRQPIALDAWPFFPPPATGRFTTVMQWDSYPVREYGGVNYGMKSQSFQAYRDLPAKTTAPLELAMATSETRRVELQRLGWVVRDPMEVTRSPWDYQHYIRQSLGEFSVAKHGYVVGRTGWFSERSACYLASGRPVVVEDTGFSRVLPTGRGVHAFSTPMQARDALACVLADYRRECSAAREIAASHFDARRVLGDLLERSLRMPGQARIPEPLPSGETQCG